MIRFPIYEVTISMPEEEMPEIAPGHRISNSETVLFEYQPTFSQFIDALRRDYEEYAALKEKSPYGDPEKNVRMVETCKAKLIMLIKAIERTDKMPTIDREGISSCSCSVGSDETLVIDGKAYNRKLPTISISKKWVEAEPGGVKALAANMSKGCQPCQ
jgi:hypothetical protein